MLLNKFMASTYILKINEASRIFQAKVQECLRSSMLQFCNDETTPALSAWLFHLVATEHLGSYLF